MNAQKSDARSESVDELLAGVRFPDPFRWLESTSDDVRRWQHEQEKEVNQYLAPWPHTNALRESVARHSTPRFAELPEWAAGLWFRKVTSEDNKGVRVVASSEPLGPGRLLFDTIKKNKTHPPHISWIAPSPNGSTLALGVCFDGSEQNTIRLIDVASGHELPDPPTQVLMDHWTCGVAWLPDSSGFYFSAIEGEATAFDQKIFFHHRDDVTRTTEVEVPEPEVPDYRVVTVAPDGRYAILLEGIPRPRPTAIAALDEPGAVEVAGGEPRADAPIWRPFVRDFDGSVAGHPIGDEYIAVVTDRSSPRGRVVAISLKSGDSAGDPASWRTVVPPSDAVIQSVQPVGSRLFVMEMVDTYARIRIVSLDGELLGEVPLPDRGALGVPPFAMLSAVRRTHPTDLLLSFTSLTQSWVRYRYVTATGKLEALDQPTATIEDAIVEDRYVTAADGAHIPYHLVHRADVSLNTEQPVLISGYGGFNTPWVPQYPGPIAAFVEAGGVFVHTHLRGGSDLGFDWWQQGRMQQKQNSFNDVYAVAEDLIASGVSTPELMSLTGGSNGGLLAGAAITQRPDLWRAVVPRVPLLDLLGACRDAYGRMVISQEYGNPEDPNEVRRIAGFSPYQLVRKGVRYPAVYVVAGATDPRCPPWHARKFVARMQSVDGEQPVLLRIWEDSGHGAANNRETAIASDTEWLAFVMRELGMQPASEKPSSR